MEKIMGTLNIGLFMSPVDKKKEKGKEKKKEAWGFSGGQQCVYL